MWLKRKISHLKGFNFMDRRFFRKHLPSVLNDIHLTFIKQESAEMRREVDEIKGLRAQNTVLAELMKGGLYTAENWLQRTRCRGVSKAENVRKGRKEDET